MAIDGTGILDSDLAHDVYNTILDLYDAGASLADIRRRVSALRSFEIDEMDREILLAASVKAYWEIGHLSAALHRQLVAVVERGKSLQQWADGGEEAVARERAGKLRRLIARTRTPRAKPRLRKQYRAVSKKLFEVGDCLELHAGGRAYRSVVCMVIEYRGACDYAMMVMAADTDADLDSYAAGYYYGHEVLGSAENWRAPHVIRPEHRMLLREGQPFRRVGHLALDPSRYMLGSFGGVLTMQHVFEDFERTQQGAGVFGLSLMPLRELLRQD